MKKFTLDDIQDFLESIGFTWMDKQICVNGKYRNAKIQDFKGKPVFLYLKMHVNSQYFLAKVDVTNTKFELNISTNTVKASSIWEEYLNEKHIVKTPTKQTTI